jgi:hypothetical protein
MSVVLVEWVGGKASADACMLMSSLSVMSSYRAQTGARAAGKRIARYYADFERIFHDGTAERDYTRAITGPGIFRNRAAPTTMPSLAWC